MNGNHLTEQSYWDQKNLPYALRFISSDDKQARWLESVLIQYGSRFGRSFEIGCYPGRFQGILGQRGFELNGIDIASEVSDRLMCWIKESGFKVGNFRRADFENMAADEKYDLVCSFGFIEHFVDWQSVFCKHIDFVLPGGLLIITVPNFRGAAQRLLHSWLDKENFNRHNLKSMNPNLWRKISVRAGMDVLFAGYFGEFDFWVDRAERTRFQNLVLAKIGSMLPWLRQIPFSCSVFSPYIGIVARKYS